MKKSYNIVTLVGAIIGLGIIGFAKDIVDWKPQTSVVTVSYEDIENIEAKTFAGENGCDLNIDIEPKVGHYTGTLTYHWSEYTVSVTVEDKTAPVIQKKKDIKVVQGQEIKNWNDYFEAKDELDGGIEPTVSKVDWNKVGTQKVEVTAKDKSGNECKETFVVEITKKPEDKKKEQTTPTPVNGGITPQTSGNMYSYRSLGKTTLSTKDFGKDTTGLQSALDSNSSYQVADYNTALKYVNTLYQNYGVVASIVSGSTKNGTVTKVAFQTQNGDNYNKQIDQLAYSICGNSGTLDQLLSRICEYEKTHFTYVSGQNNVETLLNSKTGNCDSMSRFMVDILARYGLTATQIGQNSHAWVQVNGYYSDPTFYATSGGNSSYIMSNIRN